MPNAVMPTQLLQCNLWNTIHAEIDYREELRKDAGLVYVHGYKTVIQCSSSSLTLCTFCSL
jgi:hypothetical protein